MKEQYIKWMTDIGFYPITNGLWQSFKVLHQPPTNIEQRKEVERYIKKNTGKSNGLYIYQHSSGDIIYIGKGKPIASRLISHYVESFQPVRGDTKDKKWHRFFKSYQGELTVYWKELEEDHDRRIVEAILHK